MIYGLVNGVADASIIVGAMTMLGVVTTAVLQRQGNKGGADFNRTFQDFSEKFGDFQAATHLEHKRATAEMKSLREDASVMFSMFVDHVTERDSNHAGHVRSPNR